MIQFKVSMSHEKETSTETAVLQEKVSDYPSASANKDPLLYPGERPESSYLTDGEAVYMVDSHHDDEGKLVFEMTVNGETITMNDYLLEQGVPTMEERIPILAFGANVSPSSIATKFAKVGRPNALIVPTIYAKLPGKDIVWSSPGLTGNPVAILYEGEETKNTDVQVAINFLTPEQVLVMHQSEMTYDLSSVDVGVDGQMIRSFYYAGRNNIYLRDGHPVAIASIPAEGRDLSASSATSLLDEMMDKPEIQEALTKTYPDVSGGNARTYVDFAKSLPLAKDSTDRQTLKSIVVNTLNEHENARFAEIKDAFETRQSWANPSTLPTLGDQQEGILHKDVYRLPSQELSNWANRDARATTLRSMTGHLIRMSGGALKLASDKTPKK
jgi:hypothetical protein